MGKRRYNPLANLHGFVGVSVLRAPTYNGAVGIADRDGHTVVTTRDVDQIVLRLPYLATYSYLNIWTDYFELVF